MKLTLAADYPQSPPKGRFESTSRRKPSRLRKPKTKHRKFGNQRPLATYSANQKALTHSLGAWNAGYFLTKIFHPNVSKTGEICVNVLKKDWKPDLGIRHVLLVIRCLLIEPFPESALNEEAGKLLLDDYEDYAKHARLMTSIHASKRYIFAPKCTNSLLTKRRRTKSSSILEYNEWIYPFIDFIGWARRLEVLSCHFIASLCICRVSLYSVDRLPGFDAC